MKDQLALLRKCIVNDIPAIVFQGDDSCTVEVLEAAIEIYRRHGASREFLYNSKCLAEPSVIYTQFNGICVDKPRTCCA